MTTITLIVMSACICCISASASKKVGHYPGQYSQYPDNRYDYRPTPYPSRPAYPYVPKYPGYVYGPSSIFSQKRPQGPDGQGGRGGDGAGRGGSGGLGGRGGQAGGMEGRGGQAGGMGRRGGQAGGMGGRGGQSGGMGGRGGQAGGMGGRGRQAGGSGNRGGKAEGGRRGGIVRSKAPSNPSDAIAFSGNRKTSQYFFQRGPVIFDDVTTNIGGGYNSDYGVFTAFESGIYLVNYNVVSQRKGAKNAAVDLFRNNEVINSASGRGSSGETSNSAVVFLSRYDQLSVQGRAESAIFCGDGGDTYCSFNVVLLKIGHFTDSKVGRPVPGW